jgi:hypothetical protein
MSLAGQGFYANLVHGQKLIALRLVGEVDAEPVVVF